MEKTFYFQLAHGSDIITDVIEYAHEGYVPVTLPMTHLPAGINAGWYRLDVENAAFALDEALKAASMEEIIAREQQEAQDELLLDLLDREVL